MNDHTLDRNDVNDEEHKKNEMDSMIIEHKKMLFPQTSLPLSESHLGTAESFRHDNMGLMRRYSEDGDLTIAHSSQIHKPTMRFETSLSINMYQIKDMFQRVCKKRGFTVIDDEREQITAMTKQFLSIKDICTNCFRGKCGTWQTVTTIRLTSRTNKITCRRKIVIKALIGEVKLIKAFFFDFSNELELHDPKIGSASPQKTTGNSFFSDHILSHSINNIKTSRYAPIIEEGNSSDGEELSMSPQNLESYSFYEFRKILSSDQYAIGKKVAEFLRDFFQTYGDVRDSAQILPQPMEKVFHKINETTETFFADFNYGKSETRKIMPFCKTSVEKYIFDKVFTHLFDMYILKYEKQSAQFRQKTQEILKETNPLRHLKFLDIPQKFWLIKPEKLNENKELKEPLKEKDIPYIDAINELSKMTKLRSPKEKLSVLLMMHSLMKSSVVEYHKGKEEIASMDEELPILIYVILCSRLENIAAEFNFVDDYVKLDSSLESEKRLMTNIKVSVQYISEEWRIE